MPIETQLDMSTYGERSVSESELLAGWGFTPQEINSLLWLQRCYQTGGSDRANIVRHMEFLRMLVQSGELEL